MQLTPSACGHSVATVDAAPVLVTFGPGTWTVEGAPVLVTVGPGTSLITGLPLCVGVTLTVIVLVGLGFARSVAVSVTVTVGAGEDVGAYTSKGVPVLLCDGPGRWCPDFPSRPIPPDSRTARNAPPAMTAATAYHQPGI